MPGQPAAHVADLLGEPSIQTGWGTAGVPVSIHRVEGDIEQWLEVERATERPAGLIIETLDAEAIGLLVIVSPDRVNPISVTLSIAVRPEWQGQGYGRDALTALIHALFDDWRVHRVELICEAANEQAAHLYQSLGFSRDGILRGATYVSGAFHDQHIYGMLETDPRPSAQ